MSEPTEQSLNHTVNPEHRTQLPAIEQAVGELALRPPRREHMFAVDAEEIEALAPGLTGGIHTFVEFVLAINPEAKELHRDLASTDEDAETSTSDMVSSYSRAELRQGKRSAFAGRLASMIQTGAQYLASFETKEEALVAGHEVMPPEMDRALGYMLSSRIVPAAGPARTFNQIAHRIGKELDRHAEGTDEAALVRRYTLLKALIYDRHEGKERPSKYHEPYPEQALMMFHVMADGNIHKQLAEELDAGMYDRFMARDMLWFLDGAQAVDGELAKLQQFATFTLNFYEINKLACYTRMVEKFDEWPTAQHQLVIDTRSLLRDRMDTERSQQARRLRDSDLLIKDPQEAFMSSVEAYTEELLQRSQITPGNRAQIMGLRAEMSRRKRGRQTPRRERKNKKQEAEVVAEAEVRRDPSRLVACSLKDFSTSESLEGMIDEFVDGASQGNRTVREDVERMLSFMARRDLPPAHRRGVKTINGFKVNFGTDEEPDKLWTIYEFKPTEAAGLPTRTSVAKNSRIYFIRPDADTIGIIGIKPRADQESFLRSIRVRVKVRDAETEDR